MNDLFFRLTYRVFAGCLLCIGIVAKLPAQDTITVFAEDVLEEEFIGTYQYFDLGCSVNEWDGYFAPARWHKTLTTGEVSRHPPLLAEFLQEDAPGALVVFDTDREEVETWSIEIPVDGYLAFRLLAAGPSGEEEISVSINGELPPGKVRSNGRYYSPFLRAGDQFSLHIPAGSTAYQWSQLRFHTNYTAVIVRPEAPTSKERFTGIRQGRIQRVLFPEDGYGTWPVFDMDGDPLTEYDRQVLRQTTERFEVDYEDQLVRDGDTYYLQRTFTVRERCRKGNWLRRSRKWAVLPLISD